MSAAKKAALTVDTSAALNFYTDWQQSQVGLIRQGELLTINYDPKRLSACRTYHNGMPAWDLLATVHFSPSGETITGNLVQHLGAQGVLDPPKPVPLAVRVPADAMGAEMWFQNTSITSRCSAFDSQFGYNYRFIVDQAGPAQPVMYRTGTQRSVEMVNVFAEKIAKIRRPCGNTPSAGSQLETHLDLTVWARNVAYNKNVWVDLHVFDQDDNRVNADTLTLKYSSSAGGTGDFFSLKQLVFWGSGGVPGNVWPRADVRRMQYRVYYEVNGAVFTDGILHQVSLPADAEINQEAIATAAA
jgi:Family of unknown function (DUF6209)